MAILSLSSDKLKYDKLKEEPLGKVQYDPVGKVESSRVKEYDSRLGYAMHPEEKEATLAYEKNVGLAAEQQQKAITDYDNTYKTKMSAADSSGAGIISQAQAQLSSVKKPSFDLVPIRVVNGNNIEQTYMLPRSVAEGLHEKFTGGNEAYLSNWVDDGKALNVDVNVGGQPYGKELHQALTDAVEQVNSAQKINDDAYNTAMKTGGMNIESARQTLASQKGIAEKYHTQEMSQANSVLDSIKSKWTDHVSEQQAAFQNGIKTNDGGIRDLLQSGALTVKGSV